MTCTSITKWVERKKWVALDGTEHEEVHVRAYNLNPDGLEALGHEALRIAAEWRKEIAERVPTPPTHQVFTFNCNGNDTSRSIAVTAALQTILPSVKTPGGAR